MSKECGKDVQLPGLGAHHSSHHYHWPINPTPMNLVAGIQSLLRAMHVLTGKVFKQIAPSSPLHVTQDGTASTGRKRSHALSEHLEIFWSSLPELDQWIVEHVCEANWKQNNAADRMDRCPDATLPICNGQANLNENGRFLGCRIDVGRALPTSCTSVSSKNEVGMPVYYAPFVNAPTGNTALTCPAIDSVEMFFQRTNTRIISEIHCGKTSQLGLMVLEISSDGKILDILATDPTMEQQEAPPSDQVKLVEPVPLHRSSHAHTQKCTQATSRSSLKRPSQADPNPRTSKRSKTEEPKKHVMLEIGDFHPTRVSVAYTSVTYSTLRYSKGYEPRLRSVERKVSHSQDSKPLQMAYSIELDDGAIIEVPDLANDGRNWKTYCDIILQIAAIENLLPQYDGTDVKPVNATERELKEWEQRNKMAQLPIMLTIPDLLLTRVMHLETAREWIKYFEDLFDLKKSDTTQQEAKCNPRTHVDTHQKHSEDARKPRKRRATANKPKSTEAVEQRDSKRRERKRKARDPGRVEMRDRRGKRAARQTSEQGAAAREPGEEAVDKATRSVSLANVPSSQDDHSRDMGVHCTRVTSPTPQMARPVASKAATDAITPNATSARPPKPAGASHELQDEPRKSMGSYPGSRGKNVDSRGPDAHCMHVTAQKLRTASPIASKAAADAANPNATSARPTGPAGTSRKPRDEPQMEAGQDVDKGVEREGEKGEKLKGKANEEVATAKGPGEDATDRGADSVSLAAPASSPADETAARVPGKSTTNPTTDGVSLAVPASSPSDCGGATSMSKTTESTVDTNAIATPPSVPLEGERDSQVANGSTGVHGDTAEMWGNAQKCTNGAHASQQHDASANGEGRSAWTGRHHSLHRPKSAALRDDNDDEEVESSMSGRPPSMPLEGERYAQRRASGTHAGRTSDSGRVPNGIIEDPGGHGRAKRASRAQHTRENPEHATRGECNSQATNGHSAKERSPPLEEQRGAQSQRHANGTRTGQRYANAHSEGRSARAERRASCMMNRSPRVPNGIVEDPGGCVKPSASDQTPAAEAASTPAPPSTLLKGKRGGQRSSNCADDETAARVRRAQMESQQGVLGVEAGCQHKGRMQGDAPTPLSMPLEDEQGAQMATSHANEEVHIRSGTQAEDDVTSQQVGTNPKDDAPATRIRAPYDPGGDILKRSQLREVKEERRDWGDEDSITRDSQVSRRDSATRGISHDSKRVETAGPPAEGEAHQDQRYAHRRRDDVPEARTRPAKCPKQPVESANPPRRRGRLKTQPARSHRARAYEETRIRSRRDRPRQIRSTGSIGYRPQMLGEHHRTAGTKKNSKPDTRSPRAPHSPDMQTRRELPNRAIGQVYRAQSIFGHTLYIRTKNYMCLWNLLIGGVLEIGDFHPTRVSVAYTSVTYSTLSMTLETVKASCSNIQLEMSKPSSRPLSLFSPSLHKEIMSNTYSA
ncbi:hypothetical protein BU15DRAFT_63690 [Melanogaster broomeanus]|nr:hypothetical protein BU15DRAFT_63690 [Melanogaster broomeanus]